MPSYLTDPRNSFVPTNLYTPNFDAIGGVLRIKQDDYRRGFDEVKNTHNSILNSALTKEANVQDRALYLKNAEEQLRNLSSADLSLSQNVAKSKEVFQPFFQDREIAMDMQWTKQNQSEIQKGLMLRDSKDEKQRSQYFGESIQVLQDQADKVRNAAKGDTSVYEAKRYVPYKDPNAHLNEQAKAQGLSIEWTEGGNSPQLYEFKNGKKVQKDFKNWASQQLATPEFNDIFNVMGEFDMNSQLKAYQRAVNPQTGAAYTEAEAKSKIGSDYATQMSGYYTNLNKANADQVDQIKKQIADISKKYIGNGGKITDPDDIKTIEALGAQMSQYDDDSKSNTAEIEKWKAGGSNYQPTMDNIVNFGGRFFAKQYSERMAYNWASTYASTHQKNDIKNNTAYNDKIQNDLKYQELLLRQKELEVKVASGYFTKTGKGGVGSSNKRADGTTAVPGDADYNENDIADLSEWGSNSGKISGAAQQKLFQQSANSGVDNGFSSTDIQHVQHPDQVFRENLKQDYNNAIDIRFDAFSKILPALDITLKDGTKIGKSEAIAYANQAREVFKDGTVHGKDAITTKLADYLKEQGFSVKDKSPTTVVNALKSLVQKRVDDFAAAKSELPTEFSTGLVEMNQADDLYNKWDQQFNHYNKQVNKLLEGNRTYSSIAVKDGDNTRILDANDLAKDFKILTPALTQKMSVPVPGQMFDMHVQVGANISPKELAEKYISGEAKIKIFREGLASKARSGGGEDYGTITIGDKEYNLNGQMLGVLESIKARYGTPQELSTKINAVSKDAASIIGGQVKDGKMGHMIDYNVDAKIQNFGYNLVNNVTNPDNRQGTDLGGDNSIDMFLNNLKGDPSKVTTATQLTVTNKGVPGVKLVFDPKLFATVNGVKEYKSMGLSDDDAEAIQKNGGVTVYLAPAAKGQAIDNLVHPKDRFIYQNVINGEQLKSTPLQETTNFRYTLTPDNYGRTGTSQASSAHLKVEVKKVDPKTGIWSDWIPFNGLGVEGETSIPLAGDNGKSIDEVKNQIDRLYQHHLTSSNEIIKGRNKALVDTPAPPNAETTEQILKRIMRGSK